MDLIDLFPRTIAVADLHSLTPDVIARAIDLIDLDSGGNPVSGDGEFTREQHLLDKALFREIRTEILVLCREFARSYSHIVDDIAICNSWGNVVSRGEAIRYHRHSNAYISGSFYLTGGSPLNIIDRDRENLFGFSPRLKPGHNPRALENFSISPRPGRIVLFPSGMVHSVLPSESPERRYSIAFNAIPTGRIGIPTGILELRPLRE